MSELALYKNLLNYNNNEDNLYNIVSVSATDNYYGGLNHYAANHVVVLHREPDIQTYTFKTVYNEQYITHTVHMPDQYMFIRCYHSNNMRPVILTETLFHLGHAHKLGMDGKPLINFLTNHTSMSPCTNYACSLTDSYITGINGILKNYLSSSYNYDYAMQTVMYNAEFFAFAKFLGCNFNDFRTFCEEYIHMAALTGYTAATGYAKYWFRKLAGRKRCVRMTDSSNSSQQGCYYLFLYVWSVFGEKSSPTIWTEFEEYVKNAKDAFVYTRTNVNSYLTNAGYNLNTSLIYDKDKIKELISGKLEQLGSIPG